MGDPDGGYEQYFTMEYPGEGECDTTNHEITGELSLNGELLSLVSFEDDTKQFKVNTNIGDKNYEIEQINFKIKFSKEGYSYLDFYMYK